MLENICKWDMNEIIYNNIDAIVNENATLIAGRPGSGKSVLTSAMLLRLTGYDPTLINIIIFDLKRVEMARWEDFPHVTGVVTEPEDVNDMFDKIIDKMEDRYRDMKRRKLLQSDHRLIYVIIDELAQVLRVKGAEERIDQLLRLARAANIRLVMATQNPSRQNIPACIQQNVACAVGLRCRNAIESRQIIGVKGCETLPRYGKAYVETADGLFLIDIPFVTNEEIEEQLNYWKQGRRYYA